MSTGASLTMDEPNVIVLVYRETGTWFVCVFFFFSPMSLT